MIFSDNMGEAFLPDAKAYVVMEGQSEKTVGAQPSMPIKDVEHMQSQFYIPWGVGNLFPEDVLGVIKKDPAMPQLIRWKASVAAGRGLRAVEVIDLDSEGNDIYKPINDLEIKSFYESPQLYRWMLEAYTDLYTFQNQGSELILTKDRSKIVQLVHQEMRYARFAERNDDGILDKIILNANWPRVNEVDEYSTEVPVIDIYNYDPIEQVKQGKDYKYWYPGSYPAAGDDVYQTPTWWGLVESKWQDVRKQIPIFKKFLIKNRMHILYQIHIPALYWSSIYKDWNSKTPAERAKLKKAKLDELNKFLTNPENAGKAFASDYFINEQNGNEYGKWEIKNFKDGEKEGKHLEDFQESTANMFYAFGVDPTLPGFASKDIGSRSGGSDKREAWLIYKEAIIPDRHMITEQAMFVAQYNGWIKRYPNLKLIHIDKVLTTLDTGAGTKKTVG